MEIKILVPENRQEDLERFINVCKEYGFELVNQGGGRMPSFSGYYATLKGDSWGNSPYKAKADKWDKLDEKIATFYPDGYTDDTEDNEYDDGLIGIGEAAASAFGYL
ncbi:hypothetical protein [Chryseobacterium sediminis]|uniref:Uncharacterized protein n=1 Tax=Chryseobacterium sediminis TaxID=1679494 RepID=A0A5B2U901_9FLAO|nr:hypothetical protein [Chryseobacterium sediminis]KAA2223019.1 hypothetical protein FW780_02105 [Chryseobacterium sediminis]